jgi:5-methylcytosine-specific restriction endonuclease McrA
MANWHHSNDWKKAREYAKTVLDPICNICGLELVGADWTIDHIIPAGETNEPNHDISNLQSLCRQCNGRKQDKAAIRVAWRSPRFK